jgi:hypothetical protein
MRLYLCCLKINNHPVISHDRYFVEEVGVNKEVEMG